MSRKKIRIVEQERPSFDWGTMVNEGKRVKHFTEKFKSKSLIESFESVYPELCLSGVAFKNDVNTVHKELQPGEIVDLEISTLGKTSTTFSAFGVKENIASRQVLSKYAAIKNALAENPGHPLSVTAQIISNEKGQVYVDVVKPIYNDWVKQVLSSSSKQLGIVQTVEDLQLVRGGYVGKINVKNVESLTGNPYYVDAFIPGSQIALNIEKDFDKWVGKSVDVFVTNQSIKGDNESFVCSRKNVLQFMGSTYLIQLYNLLEMGGELSKDPTQGVITGILHSAKICGVFVEVPSLNITGLVEMPAKELASHGFGKEVTVQLLKLDVPSNQVAYKVNKGKLVYCNIKPVFKLV